MFGYRLIFAKLIMLAMSLVVVSMSMIVPATATSEVVGRASVVDGDTIDIHGERVRFNGIDAPESSQLCLDNNQETYRCGAAAANALADFLASSSPVTCTLISRDQYGRFVGNCFLNNGESVQEWMVSSGLALDWPKYSNGKYAAHQEAARKRGFGIWRGSFAFPWDWRAGRKTRSQGTNAAKESRQLPDCPIKGNISSDGSRIFHKPGQRFYERTRISEHDGERWFCTEKDALSAGWRPSRR